MDFTDLPSLIRGFMLFACLLINCCHCSDIHGGVPMGPKIGCDDGKQNINIDWDPASTEEFTCNENTTRLGVSDTFEVYCEPEPNRPTHICSDKNITYSEDIPASGPHRPVWPAYGDYRYIPRQRYLHSLEHGAIVFLYHPCVELAEITRFKMLAKKCLRRHIISANKNMPNGINFVLLSWGCRLQRGKYHHTDFTKFVKDHALHGREQVYADGHYDAGIIERAETVSTMDDSELCPAVY